MHIAQNERANQYRSRTCCSKPSRIHPRHRRLCHGGKGTRAKKDLVYGTRYGRIYDGFGCCDRCGPRYRIRIVYWM